MTSTRTGRALAIASFAALAALTGCEAAPDTAATQISSPIPDILERVTLYGMPCLVWKDKVSSGSTAYAYSGLSCDWTRYRPDARTDRIDDSVETITLDGKLCLVWT